MIFNYALIMLLAGLIFGLWTKEENRYVDLVSIYLASFFGVTISLILILDQPINLSVCLVPLAYTVGFGVVLKARDKLH